MNLSSTVSIINRLLSSSTPSLSSLLSSQSPITIINSKYQLYFQQLSALHTLHTAHTGTHKHACVRTPTHAHTHAHTQTHTHHTDVQNPQSCVGVHTHKVYAVKWGSGVQRNRLEKPQLWLFGRNHMLLSPTLPLISSHIQISFELYEGSALEVRDLT